MTQDYDNEFEDDDQNDDGGHVTLSRSQIRAMERDAKLARSANERADSLQRELAFARVGAEFTERQQKALLASLDGDVTTESIRTAAEELGFLAPSAPAEDVAASERIASAANGAPSEDLDDPVARLHRADREGGKEGVLAELQRQGVSLVSGA